MKPFLFLRKVLRYFSLEAEIDDYDKIHDTIVKDVVFKGTNLWILMFAIIVASVGLNTNSTAVIIGAMLISPLMGPINGMGYSIATYNFPLFRQALKNFVFAVITSLVASSAYFFLSPLSTAHSELLARTSPTIYDVLIALFGGLAGIVAISSKQKGNVIPGVAIATALMPPLCTAGYGLASGRYEFFLGAFYLFTINTVFIALSSVAVSQLLKFPIRTLVEEEQRRRVNQWITAVIILVAFPSIYFGYNLVQKERFSERANRYVADVTLFEGNILLKSEIDPDRQSIRLLYGGLSLDEQQKDRIRQRAQAYTLSDAAIAVDQGLNLETADLRNTETETLRAEINDLQQRLRVREARLDSLTRPDPTGEAVAREIRALFPFVTTCTLTRGYRYGPDSTAAVAVVTLGTDKRRVSPEERIRLEQWLQMRINVGALHVMFE